jgi:hypothetical protein
MFLKHFKRPVAVEGPPPVEASAYEGEIEEELRKHIAED